jgi:hypothetical protein
MASSRRSVRELESVRDSGQKRGAQSKVRMPHHPPAMVQPMSCASELISLQAVIATCTRGKCLHALDPNEYLDPEVRLRVSVLPVPLSGW